jgi:hypothetical protein
MGQLNSFGAIFTFAIEMEGRVRDYYKAIGDSEKAEAAEERIEKLERSRRENVLEITLEPIDGLSEEDYVLNLSDSSVAGQKAVAQIAAKFYEDTAPKINVRQAQRSLERCGREHQDD